MNSGIRYDNIDMEHFENETRLFSIYLSDKGSKVQNNDEN